MKWLLSIVLLSTIAVVCGQVQRAPIHDPPWLKGPSLLHGMVSHWRMDELSGIRFDSHFTNHLPVTPSGFVTNVTGKVTNFITGSVSNAIDFQGGYLELAPGHWITPSNAFGTTFTFAGWALLDSVLGEQAFISQFEGAVGGYVIQTSTTNLIFYVDGTGALDSITANIFLQTGTWYFFVAWHDSALDTINIQINNGIIASKSHTDGIVSPNGNFTMGNQNSSPRPMNGRLDSVSYWRRALSTEERTALYNNGNGLDYPFGR